MTAATGCTAPEVPVGYLKHVKKLKPSRNPVDGFIRSSSNKNILPGERLVPRYLKSLNSLRFQSETLFLSHMQSSSKSNFGLAMNQLSSAVSIRGMSHQEKALHHFTDIDPGSIPRQIVNSFLFPPFHQERCLRAVPIPFSAANNITKT